VSRNNQVVRVLNLFFLLCKHKKFGLGISEACDSLAVSRRTLYRDLEALKEVGVELEHLKNDADELRVYLKRLPIFFEQK
jgi:predicted DNA-binding transcriptional regulator YafY